MNLKMVLIDLQCEMVAERTLINPKDISWLQYDILYQLKKEGASLPSSLSVILGVSRTKLSKALKGLKSMGYLEQLSSQSDGRERYTNITDAGEQLLLGISDRHDSLFQTAINVLSKSEQEIFSQLSEKLSNGLKKERIEKNE